MRGTTAKSRQAIVSITRQHERSRTLTPPSQLSGYGHAVRWLLLLTLASFSGCGGCRSEDDKLTREELEKRAKEQKESLQMSSLLTLPTDSQAKVATVKPGHWYEVQQQFKSNREDLQVVAVGDLARGLEPVILPGTNVMNEYTRRTSLPKGQTKTVELGLFIPESGERNPDPFAQPPRLVLRTQLRSWPLMTPILQTPQLQPTNELKPSEFQLVVLSPQALSYEFLTVLDAVYWRGEDNIDEPRTRSYQVSLVKPEEGKYAIPHSMLTMTATAVIVWDDVSIDELTSDQQTALIDWLHWGGQLIISGPSSWSRLQNSFLSPYLPAISADAAEFTTADFHELSQTWAVPDFSKSEQTPLDILGAPVGGLRFKLNNFGKWLPRTGELVAERQVGRGRVVVTSFPLREPRINRWKYFSNFVSSGLLRRPAREIRKNEEGMQRQVWAGALGGLSKDARLHSNFRILSRDLPLSAGVVSATDESQMEQLKLQSAAISTTENEINAAAPLKANAAPGVGDFEALRWGGHGAAWNDYSGLSIQSLSALRKAAGIELPDRWTIIYLITGYLIFLVPLNWLVFRILGRLEFAWIAAPIMALIGVVIVTRVAQLDIGFARRTTEISVLELHADHSRGHLTRYLALYTSLSTNYSVEFPESSSVVLPLADITRVARRAGQDLRSIRTNFGTSSGVVLEPLTVYSNSTEMLHAEQMVALGGDVSLAQTDEGGWKLLNGTTLPLRGALLLRNDAGVVSHAWVGDVAQKTATAVKFERSTLGQLWQNWDADPATFITDSNGALASEPGDSLWIGGVLAELVRKTPLVLGQSRLFAYTDARPGELKITPAEDQFDGRCVVVAHLSPAQLGPIQPDLNIWSRLGEVSGETFAPSELMDEQ